MSGHDPAASYALERCGCGDPATSALLDDHGFVHTAACAAHLNLIAERFVPSLFVVAIAESA